MRWERANARYVGLDFRRVSVMQTRGERERVGAEGVGAEGVGAEGGGAEGVGADGGWAEGGCARMLKAHTFRQLLGIVALAVHVGGSR